MRKPRSRFIPSRMKFTLTPTDTAIKYISPNVTPKMMMTKRLSTSRSYPSTSILHTASNPNTAPHWPSSPNTDHGYRQTQP